MDLGAAGEEGAVCEQLAEDRAGRPRVDGRGLGAGAQEQLGSPVP